MLQGRLEWGAAFGERVRKDELHRPSGLLRRFQGFSGLVSEKVVAFLLRILVESQTASTPFVTVRRSP